jgi:hypothetical protein
MISKRIAALFLIAFSFHFAASAQMNVEDSSSYRTALTHTLAVYYQQARDQSPLYNGRLYADFPFSFVSGSAFFQSNNYSDGSVLYDGILYEHVPLLYDDMRQELITRDEGYWLQLVNERISRFTIFDHDFIRMVTDSASKSPVRTGMYEILYDGKSEVLKKEIKTIKEDLSSVDGILRSVLESSEYFIKTGNGYVRVRSKAELVDIFKTHKKEIQRFLKKNKLKYRRDKENTIEKTAAYYDLITK